MYALIHKHEIQVGPRMWTYGFFKEYLEEENLDSSSLPLSAPQGVVVGEGWKIVPVEIEEPGYDFIFQRLAGPFLTIGGDKVTGYYNVIDNDIGLAKNSLKDIVANTRYSVEVRGCPYTFDDGTEVTIYTSRGDRSVYLDAYQIMPDGESIVFKFPNSTFKAVTKAELGNIIAVGAAHIEGAFVWESQVCAAIDGAATIEELKAININHPSQVINLL